MTSQHSNQFQNMSIGSSLGDVAYFIGSAMSVDKRRKYEMESLDFCLDFLAKQSGLKMTRDEVMFEYRRGYLLGWGWILTPYVWHSEERIRAMNGRYVSALEDWEIMEELGAWK